MVIPSELKFVPAFELNMQLFYAGWQGDKARPFTLIYEPIVSRLLGFTLKRE